MNNFFKFCLLAIICALFLGTAEAQRGGAAATARAGAAGGEGGCGKPWGDTELGILIARYNQGRSAIQITATLRNRTLQEVEAKVGELQSSGTLVAKEGGAAAAAAAGRR